MDGLRIRVRGQVQGVGFRPFIWQLARRFGITGEVLNDPEGVLVHACGADLGAFVAAITRVIARRLDDSVMQVTPHGPMILRRARGMVPDTLPCRRGLRTPNRSSPSARISNPRSA